MNRLKFRVWDYEVKSFVGKDLKINECNFAYGVTFQQFTGVKDLEGKDIYEGDIVENLTVDEEYCSPAIVVPTKYEYTGWSLAFKDKNQHLKDFQKEKLGHSINNIEVYEEFQLQQKNFGYYKILGNIFENPELLK